MCLDNCRIPLNEECVHTQVTRKTKNRAMELIKTCRAQGVHVLDSVNDFEGKEGYIICYSLNRKELSLEPELFVETERFPVPEFSKNVSFSQFENFYRHT